MARIRQTSFDYMMKNSYSFFANNFTGSLVQKIGRFARSFERLYDTLIFNVIPLIINLVGVIVIVYFQAPAISYVIMVWAVIIIIFGYFFSVWKLKYNIEAAKADTATGAQLSDSVTNQSTIVSFTGFNRESESFKKTTNDQAKIQRFNWNLSNIVDAVQSGLIVVVEFFIFYYAIKLWQVGSITIGTFVLIQVYILGLANRLWGFNGIIKNLYECFADSKEMVEILETPHEIVDKVGAKDLGVDKGEVEFKDVHFAFNENKDVFSGINLDIKGGEKVALIGPSGAGKSTTVKLLLRLYDLKFGSILIDGQDIKEVTQESLHRNISLVPQDPILFHRSLMENIRYGREGASDEEVAEAARLAHCAEFIESLPLKYETLVGERGIKLSGGERQRIAIARAILKNAPILILDEATSSLDSHSESLIQDALGKLMENKTSIVIAHRLSTIRKMDRVIVIDDGRVSEQGSHDELLKNEDGLYKKLWNLQAGGFLVE
jgi:ATP-binding cassette subfamily B protein